MSGIAKVVVVATLAAGCATHAPRPVTAECISGCVVVAHETAVRAKGKSRSPVQDMPAQMHETISASADSTQAFAIGIVQNADASAMHASFALQPGMSFKNVKSMVRTARSEAQVARASADSAIRQGDRIAQSVSGLPSAANRPWNQSAEYAHYWKLARHELVLARDEATRAVEAADVALVCATAVCARQNIAALKAKSRQSAGATRQAEPLLRIALAFASSRYATGL